MADKEFLLITKARELLVYTRAATKPINSDVPSGDVQKVLHKIAGLDDLGKCAKYVSLQPHRSVSGERMASQNTASGILARI